MNFLQKAVDIVDAAVGDSVEGMFYDVIALNAEHFGKLKLISTKEDFKLYSEWTTYHVVLHKPSVSSIAYSMIRVTLRQGEATRQLELFSGAIQPLLTAAEAKLLNDHNLLELLADSLRPNPGWTSAHLAAKAGLVECFKSEAVSKLINERDAATGLTPLMVAVEAENIAAIKELLGLRARLRIQDNKGNTVFHYTAKAKNQKIIQSFYNLDEKYLDGSFDLRNNDGKTPFQLAVENKKQECGVRMLIAGCDPNSALRAAIKGDNPDLVKMAIIVGADVNLVSGGFSPVQLVKDTNGKNNKQIRELLTRVGATVSGVPEKTASSLTTEQKETELLPSGDRVICLDGGGVKGLVVVQLMIAIEKAAGKKLKDCFDWITGTSIGGILALAASRGITGKSCLGLLFEFKDVVFQGARVYEAEPLENCLKQYYGEKTMMSDVKAPPRVFVTGVMGDRHPADLHLFRNYEVPDNVETGVVINRDPSLVLDPPPKPNEVYMWEAARATSAAPTLYPAYDRFLDGGLIANNPTMDTLTEIHQVYDALRRKGQQTPPIRLVVSLGTGIPPLEKTDTYNIYKPSGPVELFKVVAASLNLVEHLVEQCTQSNGRSVERAAAWCKSINVEYQRFNPLTKSVEVDCSSDPKLIDMVYDTQCYIYDNRDRFARLGRQLAAGK